jgi:hypothetical protein
MRGTRSDECQPTEDDKDADDRTEAAHHRGGNEGTLHEVVGKKVKHGALSGLPSYS